MGDFHRARPAVVGAVFCIHGLMAGRVVVVLAGFSWIPFVWLWVLGMTAHDVTVGVSTIFTSSGVACSLGAF